MCHCLYRHHYYLKPLSKCHAIDSAVPYLLPLICAIDIAEHRDTADVVCVIAYIGISHGFAAALESLECLVNVVHIADVVCV